MFKVFCFILGMVFMLLVLAMPVVTFSDVCSLVLYLVGGISFFYLAMRKGNS